MNSREDDHDAGEKYFTLDIQMKRFEISLAQKDLEIANLSSEVTKLVNTANLKVIAKLFDNAG